MNNNKKSNKKWSRIKERLRPRKKVKSNANNNEQQLPIPTVTLEGTIVEKPIINDRPFLPGEEEALLNNKYIKIPLENNSDQAALMLYRVAEDFLKRIAPHLHITRIEYIVNPTLLQKFKARMAGMADPNVCWAIHATSRKNAESICSSNFDVNKIGSHMGNQGFYGKGFYFSENSVFSHYGPSLVLCQIIKGKVFRAFYPQHLGASCEPGYDSHVGSWETCQETDAILPCFLLEVESVSQAGWSNVTTSSSRPSCTII